jgi:2-amino-4-hydroxy-6-hydroxymethyldihydropteridine diphosphokinase
VARSSSVYETAPVGPPQPDYLNAVLEVATTLSPRALLDACLAVEERMGRVRIERWGPRVIDVDVLTYADERIDEDGLTIPHPRMAERAFVLVPLADLDGGGQPAPAPADTRGVRFFAPPLTMQPPGG